jgi:hypothetical protein
VESSIDLQDAEVFRQIKVNEIIGSVDNEIKLEFVGLAPLLVLAADEVLGAHFERVVLLAWGM